MTRLTVSNKGAPAGSFSEQHLKEIFKQHDINRDGLLSKQELKSAFKTLGAHIPMLRAFLGLHKADANGDGYIGEEELNGLVKYASQFGYTVK